MSQTVQQVEWKLGLVAVMGVFVLLLGVLLHSAGFLALGSAIGGGGGGTFIMIEHYYQRHKGTSIASQT
jgi:preprotein translocase subunit SecG